MTQHLTINGVDICQDFHVICDEKQAFKRPERNVSTALVNGRNGEILTDYKSMKNVEIVYTCVISENFRRNYNALMDYLYSIEGYVEIIDDNDGDCYRQGYFVGNTDVDQITQDGGRFTITFNCKPQRFLRSGEQPLIFEAEEGEQGFVLPGYEAKSWLRSEISSDNSNIYKKALYYALNEDFPGTQQVRGIYFILPADTVGNYTIQLSGEQECPKFGVSSWYIEGGGEYSMYGNMSAYGNKTTYRKNATSHDLLICIGSIPERADTVFIEGEIVFSAGVYFSRSFRNPTDFDALPLIKLSGVTAAGSGRLLDIGGQSVTITKDDWDEVYIDCDGMFIYSYVDGEIVNLAPYVGFLDELVIKPGKNDLIAKPGITVEITPRWWSV